MATADELRDRLLNYTVARIGRNGQHPTRLAPLDARTNRDDASSAGRLKGMSDTFIVADPKATSVAELVATLRSATGREPRLVPVPTRLLSKILDLVGKREMFERLGGTLVAQPRKLMAAGWRPVIDTETAVAQMVQAASPRKSGTASRSTP